MNVNVVGWHLFCPANLHISYIMFYYHAKVVDKKCLQEWLVGWFYGMSNFYAKVRGRVGNYIIKSNKSLFNICIQ